MMKPLLTLLNVFFFASFAVAGDPGGFVSLYNGENLDGWQTTGNWTVCDEGVLMIKPRSGEKGWQRYSAYLWTDRKYENFVLDLEYSYPPGGNSGVFFRVGDLADPVSNGIEAQILDSSQHEGEMSHHDHGGIISAVGASKNMSKAPGEWNRMIVTCIGDHLELELNGEQIVDIQLDQTDLRDRSRKGHIGLQDHGQPNDIKFRHVRIKELP